MANNFYQVKNKNEVKSQFIKDVIKYHESKKSIVPVEKYNKLMTEQVNPAIVKIQEFDMNDVDAENSIIFNNIKMWHDIKDNNKDASIIYFMDILQRLA